MSLAADRIQAILREIDVDSNMTKGKTAQEIADILLNENTIPPMSSAEAAHPQENAVSNAPICEMHLVDNNLRQVNEKWVVEYYRPFPHHGRKYEKLVIFAKRVVRKLLKCVVEPITRVVHEFHSAVANTLNAMRNNDVVFDAHIRAIEGENIQRDSRIQAVEQASARLSEQMTGLNEWTAEQQQINAKLQFLTEQAAAMEAQYKELDTLCSQLRKYQQKQQKETDNYLDIDYFDFENHFRGSRTQIKEMQKMYLHHYVNCRNVLDLGSGRGEFMELLAENQIPVTGVDVYAPFVDYCRTRGHNVVCEDAVNFLHKQADASYDGIFAAQLAEHLSTQDLISLCRESYRVLEEGKTLILETPNPACMSTYMNSFYLDPTHVKPVHPKTLEYFVKKAGFRKVEVVYTQQSKVGYRFPLLDAPAGNLAEFNDGVNFMSDIIFGSQDYAIIAVK